MTVSQARLEQEIERLESDVIRIDKELAVCVDRVNRHDSELEDLVKEVHETKKSVNEMQSTMDKEFTSLGLGHLALKEKLKELAEAIDANTKANTEVATAYKTVVVVFSFVGTAVGGLLAVGKMIGWW